MGEVDLVHDRIRRVRRIRDLTGAEVAERLGISTQYYYNIERGRRKLSAENAMKLADVFDVSVDYLLGQSTQAIIEDSMEKKGLTLTDLSEMTKLPIGYLKNIESIQPIEPDYADISRVAKALELNPKVLHAALARQEPPTYDAPPDPKSLEEIFVDEDFPGETDSKAGNAATQSPVESAILEAINDPQIGLFFKDFLHAPEERKAELIRFWKYIQEAEKGRKPGDRQGEPPDGDE
ncbi:helix-turn-helix transcriptional regulator [Cohnella nanjingensis]|uniref:Helix-turn-helix transcriptional regulator n=1 Tax=Cohnella nanjingensis TaxID=1387779 RepID=A0A7X0RMZ2_9BACL|nr:helix-turn-helix transcriptional regulator [Cohnella nanjingensis]MBB6670499.1 helix-turn-helix transcriptional regulator [Cohnella nanjingensis]